MKQNAETDLIFIDHLIKVVLDQVPNIICYNSLDRFVIIKLFGHPSKRSILVEPFLLCPLAELVASSHDMSRPRLQRKVGNVFVAVILAA